jgi:hypothetical protein
MLVTTVAMAILVTLTIMALGGTGLCVDDGRLRARRRAQRIADRHLTTMVGDAPHGAYVKLLGTADDAEPTLVAPFSRRDCVAWEVTVFDIGGVRPVLRARASSMSRVLLRDRSGVADLMPERASIGINPDRCWTFEEGCGGARVDDLLKSVGCDEIDPHRGLLICEGVVQCGQRIVVLGYVVRSSPATRTDGGPYRAIEAITVVGTSERPLFVVSARA